MHEQRIKYNITSMYRKISTARKIDRNIYVCVCVCVETFFLRRISNKAFTNKEVGMSRLLNIKYVSSLFLRYLFIADVLFN